MQSGDVAVVNICLQEQEASVPELLVSRHALGAIQESQRVADQAIGELFPETLLALCIIPVDGHGAPKPESTSIFSPFSRCLIGVC